MAPHRMAVLTLEEAGGYHGGRGRAVQGLLLWVGGEVGWGGGEGGAPAVGGGPVPLQCTCVVCAFGLATLQHSHVQPLRPYQARQSDMSPEGAAAYAGVA
jgi:hypothetical protein